MSEFYNVAEIFGENVFNDAVMQERLPKKVYKRLKDVISQGRDLDLETADVVAHEMKEWAIEKGATHYTHWFQPLTGVTAEKHDSFIKNFCYIVKFAHIPYILSEKKGIPSFFQASWNTLVLPFVFFLNNTIPYFFGKSNRKFRNTLFLAISD